MALEVLFGPVEVTVGGVPALHINAARAWVQGLGLVMTLAPVGGGYSTYVVQMDGTAQQRSGFGAGDVVMLDLRSARGLAARDGGGNIYNFNYLAEMPDPVPFLTGATDGQVIASDRYLAFHGTDAQSSPNAVAFTSEYTFPGPASAGAVSWSRGRSATEVCIACSSNTLRFYDTVLKAQIGPTLYVGEAFNGAWYIPKWDVFIVHTVGTGNGQIKILANAIAPYSFTAIIASPAITPGHVSQLSVQFKGDQSEPCVGELINWSVTSGTASLAKAQTTTDSTGTAINSLIVPVGASGSVTVSAQLAY